MLNQLACTATQAGEIEEAERMRSMLEHESWQAAELLPQGWRWRQDPKVILRSYRREAQENNLLFEVFVSAIIPPPPQDKKIESAPTFCDLHSAHPWSQYLLKVTTINALQCNSGQLNACYLRYNCTTSLPTPLVARRSFVCFCCIDHVVVIWSNFCPRWAE